MFHFDYLTSKRPNLHLPFGRNLDAYLCCHYWPLPTLRPNVQTSNKKKKIFKSFIFSSLPHRGLCGSYIKKHFYLDSWTFGRSCKNTLENMDISRPKLLFKLGLERIQFGRMG